MYLGKNVSKYEMITEQLVFKWKEGLGLVE